MYRIFTPSFVLLLLVQLCFGFSTSIFYLIPKMLLTRIETGPPWIGIVTALSMVASVAAVPAVGPAIDRIGARGLIVFAAALNAAASLAFLAVNEIGVLLFVLRIVQGATFVAVVSAGSALCTVLSPPERLGQAFGIFGLAMLCTNALAPALVEPIADSSGWDPVFVIAAVTSLLAIPPVLATRAPTLRIVPGQPRPTAGLSEAARLLAITACAGATLGVLFTYTQPLALERGMTEVRGYFIGYTVLAIAVRVGLGGVADRVGRARVVTAALALYALAAAAVLLLQPGWLAPMGGLLGAAHGLFYPAAGALVVQNQPAARHARLLALFNGAFNGGYAAALIAFGTLAMVVGYTPLFALAAVAALGGLVLSMRPIGRAPQASS